MLKNIKKAAYFEKSTRCYQLLLGQDMLNDWIILRLNGRIDSKLHGEKQEVHESFKEALLRYSKLFNYRIENRKYFYKGKYDISENNKEIGEQSLIM